MVWTTTSTKTINNRFYNFNKIQAFRIMRKKRRKRYKIISIIKFFALIIGKVGDCFTVGASNEPKCIMAYVDWSPRKRTWNLLRFRALLSWAPLDETFLLYHMNQSPWAENLDKKACTLYQPQRFRHDQLYRVSESLILRD